MAINLTRVMKSNLLAQAVSAYEGAFKARVPPEVIKTASLGGLSRNLIEHLYGCVMSREPEREWTMRSVFGATSPLDC